jgi:hypothetical protein
VAKKLLLPLAAWLCVPLPSQADTITIAGNMAASLNGVGNFQGTLSYQDSDAGHATLTVTLTNTTSSSYGGYLTAFALNNPKHDISGITLTGKGNGNFDLIGSASGTISTIFHSFDFGASTSTTWTGSDNPTAGLGVGQQGTFVFALTGNSLDQLLRALSARWRTGAIRTVSSSSWLRSTTSAAIRAATRYRA